MSIKHDYGRLLTFIVLFDCFQFYSYSTRTDESDGCGC